MRIEVTRTGGFAGGRRTGVIDTDSAQGAADAPQWHSLAEQALREGAAEPPSGVPDGFRYTLTVDGRTVHAADPRLGEAQRELFRRVLKEGA
ncbi:MULTISPECIES: protealysin inhibitor emfourin [unclassified Streptomyces]|uniref:protealysin inhibitor emfourin n=1 Tax=unclassified Streptomyces TaxID=2593676 RepID=UPI0013C9F3D1|nr:protealysin inhibitor emfourin [Streptomyces sp. SID11385]NEA38511.1 hypothetical protein [Streptomyces sp. SID11385]